ncbi:hypothetical protein M407DRAFT_227816, partial [Tulasnella calospora MUT 4182]
LRHPNVVELLGYYLSPSYEIAQIVSPYLINGNLREYLWGKPVGMAQLLGFVRDITAGLDYLHSYSPPIIHGDLRPANVLIDLHINAVLCDFGLASFVSGSGTSPGLVTSTTLKGSPRYMSPELLMGDDCTHSLESDVWAWGCTVFQVSCLLRIWTP